MKTKQMQNKIIGQTIRVPIYSMDGDLLINEGTIINYNVLSKLKQHSIKSIDIINSLSKGIKPTGIINDTQMSESINVVKKVFDNVLHNDVDGIVSSIPPSHIELVESIVESLIESLANAGNLLYTVSDMLESLPYTYKHSVNVSILSILTAKSLKYCEADVKNIALGAFLHDIGKMLVDQTLITKTGSLTDLERKEVEKHPHLGYKLIKNIETLSFTVKQIVLMHHEKMDGSGYPFGLSGIEIPEYVKIVTICDMYDAMVTNRVYRNKMPIYTVLEILMADSVFKLDRKIYRHMTENICLHPPGSGVVLSDGTVGIVSFYRASNPSRPHIRIIDLNEDFTDIKVRTVNLEKEQTLLIVDSWDVNEFRKRFKPTFSSDKVVSEKTVIEETKIELST
ncbi:MAG: HD-GYP domain-containing protein [Acidaminobacteraceae bacterium]